MNYICHINKGNVVPIRNKIGPVAYSWIYFGSDVEILNRIKHCYGSANQLKIGKTFHLIAEEFKPKYLDYISSLGSLNSSSPAWWASGVASKSPYLSEMFKLLCYQIMILKLVKERTDLIVFIQDPFLYRSIRGQRMQGRIKYLGKPLFYAARLLIKSFLIRARTLYRLLSLKIALKNKLEVDLGSIETLVYSWIKPGSFNQKGRFIDHYLGELKSYIDKKGKNTARLTNVFFSKQQICEIEAAGEKFVVPLKHVSFLQIIRSIVSLFKFKHDNFTKFAGMDVSNLLQREMFVENATAGFFEHLLFYSALRRVFRKTRLLKLIFYPFEGQPWEKMLALAARGADPETVILGYQHSSFSPFLLNYFLGKREEKIAPIPGIILANSEYNRKRLVAGGFPRDRVLNIGALRFAYLFEEDDTPGQKGVKKNSLLICLPYNSELASEMLGYIAPVLIKLKELNIISEVKIKSHPLVPFELSERGGLGELSKIAGKATGKLKDELVEKDILLYCNGTVGIEGVYADIRLVKYLPELEVDLDPLALSEDKFNIQIYQRDNLEKALSGSVRKNGAGRVKNLLDPVDYYNIDQIYERGEVKA